MDVRVIDEARAWDEVARSCGAHPLQWWEWGAFKSETGPWTAWHIAFEEGGNTVGGAQILVRKLPFPFGSIAYVPRGPFAVDEADLPRVADACGDWCSSRIKATSLKIEPAVESIELSDQWRKSERVLLAKTAVIDLSKDEDALMKGIPNRKARQYIRKAQRDGVVVRAATADDLDEILTLYHKTAEADGFALHEDDSYRRAFDILGDVQQVFVAEFEGTIQAFLWNVTSPNGTAFELWGAVSDDGKRSRANYYLKWCAILAAKERGALLYDLNGLLNDGISDFKLLFVEEPTIWVGTYDRPLSPLYHVMDRAIAMRRKLNNRKSVQKDTSEDR